MKISTQIKFFQFVEIVSISTTLALFSSALNNSDYLPLAHKLGSFYGQLSLGLLTLILLPGIARRLSIFPIILKTLMPLRRHLGISMYLAAFSHYLLIYVLGQVIDNNFPPSTFPTFIIAGFWSLLLLTPLFITSNDFSLRLLKSFWVKLHKLVYLSLFLILLHLVLQQSLYSLIAASLLIAETASFVVYWHRNQKLTKTPIS